MTSALVVKGHSGALHWVSSDADRFFQFVIVLHRTGSYATVLQRSVWLATAWQSWDVGTLQALDLEILAIQAPFRSLLSLFLPSLAGPSLQEYYIV